MVPPAGRTTGAGSCSTATGPATATSTPCRRVGAPRRRSPTTRASTGRRCSCTSWPGGRRVHRRPLGPASPLLGLELPVPVRHHLRSLSPLHVAVGNGCRMMGPAHPPHDAAATPPRHPLPTMSAADRRRAVGRFSSSWYRSRPSVLLPQERAERADHVLMLGASPTGRRDTNLGTRTHP